MNETLDRICGGFSMAPTVRPGDEVRVVRAPLGRIRAGEAVVFVGRGDHEVLHRYLFRLPFVPYFVHRGDRKGARVGLAHCDRIIGVARIPRRRPSLREYAAGYALVFGRARRKLYRALYLRKTNTP